MNCVAFKSCKFKLHANVNLMILDESKRIPKFEISALKKCLQDTK